MGLVKVLPQRAEHTDGWAVANAGRSLVKYEQGTRRALVGIDRGRLSSRLYVDSLRSRLWSGAGGMAEPGVQRGRVHLHRGRRPHPPGEDLGEPDGLGEVREVA